MAGNMFYGFCVFFCQDKHFLLWRRNKLLPFVSPLQMWTVPKSYKYYPFTNCKDYTNVLLNGGYDENFFDRLDFSSINKSKIKWPKGKGS